MEQREAEKKEWGDMAKRQHFPTKKGKKDEEKKHSKSHRKSQLSMCLRKLQPSPTEN